MDQDVSVAEWVAALAAVSTPPDNPASIKLRYLARLPDGTTVGDGVLLVDLDVDGSPPWPTHPAVLKAMEVMANGFWDAVWRNRHPDLSAT